MNVNTTHLNNPVFDLGTNTLTFSGAVVHDDANGTITINTTYDGFNLGHIEMTNIGDSINLTNSKQLIINITDAPLTPLPLTGQTRIVDLFVENGGTLTLHNNIVINGFTSGNAANTFVNWTFDPVTGILSETLVNDPNAVLQNLVNNPNTGNLSNATLQDLFNIAATQGGAAANDAIERLTNSDAVALAVAPVNLAIQDSTQVVTNRAEGMSAPLQILQLISVASHDTNISGVSTGEGVNKYGTWVSPFYGISSQKARGLQPGYKSSYYGGIFGFDHLINDRTALGLDFSYIKTEIKHRN